jgi:hypothetical protein
MSFARADGEEGSTETEVRALMKVLIGVDPHKASGSRRCSRRSHRRAPPACQLPAEPHRLKVTQTMGQKVLRAQVGP